MTLVMYRNIHIFITSVRSNVLSDTVVGRPAACFVSVLVRQMATLVNCSSRGYKSSVPEGTGEIDMSAYPDMTMLTFHDVKPPSLRKLRLLIVRTCHLRQIGADVFSGELLPGLDILKFSHNLKKFKTVRSQVRRNIVIYVISAPEQHQIYQRCSPESLPAQTTSESRRQLNCINKQ